MHRVWMKKLDYNLYSPIGRRRKASASDTNRPTRIHTYTRIMTSRYRVSWHRVVFHGAFSPLFFRFPGQSCARAFVCISRVQTTRTGITRIWKPRRFRQTCWTTWARPCCCFLLRWSSAESFSWYAMSSTGDRGPAWSRTRRKVSVSGHHSLGTALHLHAYA